MCSTNHTADVCAKVQWSARQLNMDHTSGFHMEYYL